MNTNLLGPLLIHINKKELIKFSHQNESESES